MSNKQYLEWGMIDWVYEPTDGMQAALSVGISIMYPNAFQSKHIHYGDEQIMYIISGKGRQRVGDKEEQIITGNIYYIPAGCIHETINESNRDPLIKLLISIPISSILSLEDNYNLKNVDKRDYINENGDVILYEKAVRQTVEYAISQLRMPIAFFDCDNRLIYENAQYPDFCQEKCLQKGITCEAYTYHADYFSNTGFICPFGLSIYSVPVVYENKILGYIKGGNVREGNPSFRNIIGCAYEVPKSTVNGILTTFEKIANIICNYYLLEEMQSKIDSSELIISNQQKDEMILKESLHLTEDKMLNLQISQHFLFNTLSTIASMAIREHAENTHHAVMSLAQLLRYPLRTNSIFVTLEEEMAYVQNYLYLQKLRFEERLKIYSYIQDADLKLKIPFNCLQPIVENCFKHGFKQKSNEMILRIHCYSVQTCLYIIIEDNGCGISEEKILEMNDPEKMLLARCGTGMLYRKLESVYGNDFKYIVEKEDVGAKVMLILPLNRRHNEADFDSR